jgi:hypothetical protein
LTILQFIGWAIKDVLHAIKNVAKIQEKYGRKTATAAEG